MRITTAARQVHLAWGYVNFGLGLPRSESPLSVSASPPPSSLSLAVCVIPCFIPCVIPDVIPGVIPRGKGGRREVAVLKVVVGSAFGWTDDRIGV